MAYGFEQRVQQDDPKSKIVWDVSALVERRLNTPPKFGEPWELVGSVDFRSFAAANYPVAHLKPSEKREDGVITFLVNASYELYEYFKMGIANVPKLKFKGTFESRMMFPYHFDEGGKFVVGKDELTIDEAIPRQFPATGDNAVVLTGFASAKRDGAAPGPKYVMIAPTLGIPSLSPYEESGSTKGGEIGGKFKGSTFFNLIKWNFDASGSYSWTSTDGKTTNLPANSFIPGVFRLDLEVTPKEFPKPVPPPPTPISGDAQDIMLTNVFFAKEKQDKVDGQIRDAIAAWYDQIKQFDTRHPQYPSILEGLRSPDKLPADRKITVYFDGYASASDGDTSAGRLRNEQLSDRRAANVEEYVKVKFGRKTDTNRKGHGNEGAKWLIEVDKKGRIVGKKPVGTDRAVVIWLKLEELERYLRGSK
jgi:hypothetical protein